MFGFNLKNANSLIFIFLSAIIIFGQNANPPPDLETILKNAETQTQNYREEFKNLLSEETKTFEIFDKNGKSKKRTIVESNFIIYQTAKDESLSTEYRNVIKVDGKLVGDSEKRTVELFEEIAKADSVTQELERIQKESSRYDKNLQITGLTLSQSPILLNYARPFFDFKLLESANLNGAEVFIIEYRQIKQSPYVLINEETKEINKATLSFTIDLPKAIKKSNVFLRGKLWIDAQTFQIRREERELTAPAEASANPLVLLRFEFEYQPSDFGILAPRKFTISYFEVKTKNREFSIILDTKATFEYAKFGKSDVEVKSSDVDSPKD